MASNRELIEQIGSLSTQLGIQSETRGLNNVKLTTLAESLQQRLSAQQMDQGMVAQRVSSETQLQQQQQPTTAEAPIPEGFTGGAGYTQPMQDAKPIYPESTPLSPIEDVPKDEDPMQAGRVSPVGKFQFTVAPGKSITCQRGVLPQGHEIKLTDLGGPEEDRDKNMQHLIEIGAVLYNRSIRG